MSSDLTIKLTGEPKPFIHEEAPKKPLNEIEAKTETQNPFTSSMNDSHSPENIRRILDKVEIEDNPNPRMPSPVKIRPTSNDTSNILDVDIISYEDFEKGDPEALKLLRKGLFENGIVGIRSIPGYKEKAQQFIDTLRKFSSLPEETKNQYAPNREIGEFTGYEMGAEQFQDKNGKWVTDTGKGSYYALIPNDIKLNRWPKECDLETPFQKIGGLMFETAKKVLEKLHLYEKSGASLESRHAVGRGLIYSDESVNPLLCGEHCDHSEITALLPAFYYANNKRVPEPKDGGLFVKTTANEKFRKVVSDDPDVMLLQVGEFGQMENYDEIMATPHLVKKSQEKVERYTLAIFVSPPLETKIKPISKLKEDPRCKMDEEGYVSYETWHVESMNRYKAKKNS